MMKHDGITPRECDGAKEYAKKRLMESDEPMSPKELSDEYGCSGSHMRTQLSELKQADEIESVSYGYYNATDGDNRQEPTQSMPTQDEYNRLHNAGTEDITDNITVTPTDKTDGDNMRDDDLASDESVTSAPLPAEPKQLLVVLVVLIGLYLLYQNLNSEDETPTPSESENTAEDTTGGLIQ